jgi:hypothetical protein
MVIFRFGDCQSATQQTNCLRYAGLPTSADDHMNPAKIRNGAALAGLAKRRRVADATPVAQTGSLPYRGLAIRKPFVQQ